MYNQSCFRWELSCVEDKQSESGKIQEVFSKMNGNDKDSQSSYASHVR